MCTFMLVCPMDLENKIFKMPPNHTALLSMIKNKFCTLIFESPLLNKVTISDVCFAFSQWCFYFYVILSWKPEKEAHN